MGVVKSFTELLGSANILTVCLWAMGFVLFSVEFFQPMRGVGYALGGTLLAAAFATHMIHGSAGQAFMFVLLTALGIYIVHVVSLIIQKRDWLKVARLEKSGGRRYGSLVNSIGVANTAIDLTGNATVGDINLVVCSETPIPAGDKVRVVKVTPDKIIVERVD